MRFHWHDTLKRLTGSETRCPVCKADGLVTWERNERHVLPDLRGIPYCECPRCGARGEFPELVAKALAKGVEETVRTLNRSGELDAGTKDLETYVARKATQAEVDAHLSVCTDHLRQAPHLGNVRAGLSASNLRQLPPDTGLHVRENAPCQFALLDAPRYQRTNLTLYRYRFDGETTCLDAQNPKTLQREHRLHVTGGPSDVGVYLGDYRFGEVPPVLLATHDPRIAAQAYGAWRAETTLPSPVVGVAGFPLPPRFEAVRTLYLLNAPDSPLPLAFAIRALMGPVVYGTEEAPDIRVLTPRAASSYITAEDLRRLTRTKEYKPLRIWIQETLLGMAERREEIANALLQAKAPESVRTELAALVGSKAPRELVETLLLPTRDPDDILTLANGRLLKVTPVGLWTAKRLPKTDEIKAGTLLANVGLTVESRVVDDGAEVAVCTATHPDDDVPSVTVRLPKSHWNNPDALAEDIRAAWAETGRTPYVAVYRSGGYAWPDILQLLGSRCPVQTGLKALGATPDGTVNFPAFAAAHGTALPQTKAGLIPDAVQAAWSAIPRDTDPWRGDPLSDLLGATVTLDRTGLAAGYLHALYCAAGVMFDRSGVRRPPAHLVFVETEAGIWDTTLRTLAYLFSGSEYVPLMDYGDRAAFLKAWSGLGTLPLVTRLPSAEDLAKDVCASPVPLIAVADPLTSLGLSGHGVVSFVLPHVEATACDPITADDIGMLRKAFAAIVTAKAGTGWMDLSHGSPRSASTPALSVLASLAGEPEAGTTAAALVRTVKGRYPGVGLTGARTFFAVLHREVTAQAHGDPASLRVTIVNGVPADTVEASFNERGEHVFVCPEHVLVSRSVVGLINKEKAFLFDAEQLSREFAENGILLDDVPKSLGIDPSRVWAFSRTTWENEVVRASGFTTKEN